MKTTSDADAGDAVEKLHTSTRIILVAIFRYIWICQLPPWFYGEFCVTVGPVTSTVGILTYSWLKALATNWAGRPASLYAGLIGFHPRWLKGLQGMDLVLCGIFFFFCLFLDSQSPVIWVHHGRPISCQIMFYSCRVCCIVMSLPRVT